MSFVARRLAAFSTAITMLAASGGSVLSQKKYDAGAAEAARVAREELDQPNSSRNPSPTPESDGWCSSR
jgi:hypothetical protein